MRLRPLFDLLLRSRSGIAMTEFALGAPFLLAAGLWGVETANFAVTNMKIGQLAVHLADNASRIGDTSTLKDRKIFESDINDIIVGAHIQGGQQLDLYTHGRVIISSLEVNAGGQQYIHWQRCRGVKPVNSAYGGQGTIVSGMGPAGEEITAEPNDAVIFVELTYEYHPLISTKFLGGDNTIRSWAAFTVRDDRDLSQIYQRDPANPDPVASCSAFSGPPPAG